MLAEGPHQLGSLSCDEGLDLDRGLQRGLQIGRCSVG